MNNVIAILSMLHEPGTPQCSATRIFRGKPVLRWTLARLRRSTRIDAVGVLCWDDQAKAVAALADEFEVQLVSRGARESLPAMEAISAARRWADGWRGGLLSTCHFDLGFYAPWHHELAEKMQASAVVLVDPAAGLIDPALLDSLVAHARANDSQELCFSPAAPGLGAALLQMPLLNRLAAAKAHAGRLLHYHPDQLSREPLAAESCAPVPTAVARTPHRLTLDSDRQIARISAAMYSLNGQLKTTAAEELVCRSHDYRAPDALPRDIVLELNTRRSTRPVFWPGASLAISRPDFSLELAKRLFAELGALNDIRLTLAGVGDPLLCPEVFEIIGAAKRESGAAIHVETDLLGVSVDQVRRLAESPIDLISVHLPAMTAQTYAGIMGCDGYGQCLENIRLLVAHRHSRATALPVVVPIFTKCTDNLGEMEAWYDQWLRALGSAVIRGPSDCAGQIPDVSVADMSPPGRTPCARLASRLTILSDGNIVSCEADVLGMQPKGRIGADFLADVWQQSFESMRKDHRQGEWEKHSLCRSCREWNRP